MPTAIYLANARPLDQIPKCDRYYALSEMNGSDVLMGTQNSRNEKSPEAS